MHSNKLSPWLQCANLHTSLLMFYGGNYKEVNFCNHSWMHVTFCLSLFLQAYVQYIKFARRAEGIKSARTGFRLAREDARSKYHVYVAAALMEYYSSKVGLHTLTNLLATI